MDQLLLFCFHYDPVSGKYTPAIMNLIRLGGGLTLVGLVVLIAALRRGERRKQKANALAHPIETEAT